MSVTRQAGARRSQETAGAWERLAPAWRMSKRRDPGFSQALVKLKSQPPAQGQVTFPCLSLIAQDSHDACGDSSNLRSGPPLRVPVHRVLPV